MRPMLTVLLLYGFYFATGQQSYPKGYFRNPLNIPIALSGNFGELRPNHFHMGIDIKTARRENLPVYAAAEGYVSRIKIEPGGFGRAIYITHPNGYTTLYAHLNNFAAKIDAFVKQQQYAHESWKVELQVPPGLLPVKRGDFIAYSGNTGGSQAPHLHFEIRRTEDDVNLNPLLFGMQLNDNVRPKILRFAVYDRTRSVYEQTPKIAAAKLSTGSYVTYPSVVKVGSPLVSFAISAFDTHTGSSNLNGIYSATLYVNDFEEESFTMNNISYNDTRYLNAHIDYRYKALGGSYLQHLSELPGFMNSIYTNGNGKGVIDISDGDIYDILVEVKDAAGNKSQLKTRVQFDPKVPLAPPATGKTFYPLMLDGCENENCEFFIGEKCLYDSVHINYRNTASGDPDVISDVHTIGASYIPLQDSFLVRIVPGLSFTEADRPYTVMQWINGGKSVVQKVQWQHQWASAKFRDFGSFRLVRDSEPPMISLSFSDGANLGLATRITFNVRDNLQSVKNVRAELDGKWLRFTNDKNRAFIYQFDEKCLSGRHVLKVSGEDEAGNKTTVSYNFVR
jgi:murein DD-endopeptidase MepM/ murein hydrolase activator NlpD